MNDRSLSRLRKKAQFCAELLDECGSLAEFRLRCAIINKDPEKVFEPYSKYAAYICVDMMP